MAKKICPDRVRYSVALAAATMLVLAAAWAQIAALATGVIFGFTFLRQEESAKIEAEESFDLRLEPPCRGEVVLPLLQAETVTPCWVGNDRFLAGYRLAQAVPGPLFSFSAYLGIMLTPPCPGG